MSDHVTFVDRALRGDVIDIDEEIDDAIDAWHMGGSGVALHEWLGLTRDEYSLFATKPSMLRAILAARRWDDMSFLDLARNSDFGLAARGASPDEVTEAHAWLRRTGRI